LKKRWAAAAAALSLAGCTSVDDMLSSKVDYKSQGKSMPSLEVPPDLTTPARDNRFVVPETGKSSATLSGFQAERKEQAKAGNTSVLPSFDNLRVERAGSERWLVVANQKPEQLWPIVKDFWQENGFLIKTEVAEVGVMETDWAENRAKVPQGFLREGLGKILDQVYSTSERDKFRTRLERTADGNGSEIYISHRGMNEVYTSPRGVSGENAQTVWTPREPDPGLEAEFLRRLMIRLGAQQERAKELAATPAPQAQRAEIRKGIDGAELLQVNEPFDRAWRRVGLALDRVGFTVEDRDRQKGLYFVRYADPESEMAIKDRERGFFSKLFGGESKLKPEQYRVLVSQASDAGQPKADVSQVQVLNKNGTAEQSTTTQRILTLLHDQLK
jgi:outer membrane protein assembly factor BamC